MALSSISLLFSGYEKTVVFIEYTIRLEVDDMENCESLLLSCKETPYPELNSIKPNKQYAAMISRNLAGRDSELTTLNQYIYQHWILNKKYPNMAQTLKKIAIVEMHHFNIFGQMMAMLNQTPRLIARYPSRKIPWNGTMINYEKNLRKLLIINMQSEKQAIKTYLSQAKRINNTSIQNMLHRIVEDEQLHLKIFECYLKCFNQ